MSQTSPSGKKVDLRASWYYMDMQKSWIATAGVVVVALGALVAYGLFVGDNSSSAVSNAEDSAVRQVVTEFGTKLKNVSLLASTSDRKAAMDANYSAYVAPELLAQWYPEGAEAALGRYTSSPWPDRINVGQVTFSNTSAVAEGTVVEVANTTGSTTEVAATYPVTVTLEKRSGQWTIVGASKGAYSDIPRSQTIVGYWECLPHKNTTGPQTAECAFGIAVDQSDGHYAINTSLMQTYPVDFPTGTKVRVTGVVVPANQLNSVQKYDIDGIINATTIEKVK